MLYRFASHFCACTALFTLDSFAFAQMPPLTPPAKPEPPASAITRIKTEAEALKPLVKSDLAKRFLEAIPRLPPVTPRSLYRDPETKALLSEAAVKNLDEEKRKTLTVIPITEKVYYDTKYGTPLAYARVLEVWGAAGVKELGGKRVLDFGYGTIGHLRLLALCGASAVGVDVDPLLPALYSAPGDTGVMPGSKGSVTIVDGQFPASETVRKAIGGGYDLILSKNTLKKGYIHPSQTVDKRLLVDLGVDDAAFVRALYDALKPGGYVLIYNLSPAPAPPGQPYKPWADGLSPFPRTVWEAAGFRVREFDRDDNAAARAMARALAWDKGPQPMDVENDLFAHYTLLQKPR